MAAPLIDSIVTLTLTTISGRPPSVGTNTAIYLSEDADASLNGTLYTTQDEITADASDLTATTAAHLAAILAEGTRVGGVYLYVYDSSGGDDPSDALDDAVSDGILPLWHYCYILIEQRTDAKIAIASTWCHTNARGRAIVLGQEDTSSILSGTVPAGIAASAGADLTVCYYDDTDSNSGIESLTGFWLATDIDTNRPGAGIATPLGLPDYATELTEAQMNAATGIGSGQARCIASGLLTPTSTYRTAWRGYTVGGTQVEIELGAIIINAKILQAISVLVESRSRPGQTPIRTTDGDAAAIEAVVSNVLEPLVGAGYIKTGVAADPATGRPDLPDGYSVTVTFDGSTAEIRGFIAFPSDVRAFSFDLTGFVS